MPNTNRIGDQNLIFGCTDENWGYVSNMKLNHGPTLVEAMNGDGEVVAGEFHKDMKKCSGEYLYRVVSGDPMAVVGTNTAITLTDLGLSFYITDASKQYSVGQWVKVSFNGVYYPNLGT